MIQFLENERGFTLDYSLIKNSIAHLSPIEQEKLLNKITERVNAGKIYEESHLHSREQFKADNPPKDVVKNLGLTLFI